MKFKLDENLANRTRSLFEKAGYDVETVLSENLVGATDDVLFEVCKEEERCLINLDLDFSDVVRYPPERNPGIIVLRLASSITLKNLESLAIQILKGLESNDPTGKLWIVEPGRIRIHRDQFQG